MKKIFKIILVCIFTLLLTLNFSTNFFSSKIEKIGVLPFVAFQSDSEYIVFSKTYMDKYLGNSSKYGLVLITDENENRINIFEDFKSNYKVVDYSSQIGLQGHIVSFMYNSLHMPFWLLKLGCCFILSIVLILICYNICFKYNKILGIIFYITFLLSPWVVAFARNLYWVEFTWFLPILFALMLSRDYSKKKIFIPLIFISIVLKCLCGYEYISTIMLSTISFFIIDLFTVADKQTRKIILKTILIVGVICIIAFILVLGIHSILRGEGNIKEGLKSIYKNDILRRTLLTSDDMQFSGLVKESIDATFIETVIKYFKWDTNIILGIDGRYFVLLFVSTFIIALFNIFTKEKDCYTDLIMIIIFLCSTLSWFVLGKSHSYIHTHINYVLWYFGFIQVCIYIVFKFICKSVYFVGQKYCMIDKKEKT